MKRIVKRAATILGVMSFVAAVLRLRGRGGKPPTGNGWRELDLTDPQ